jgi:calmodulin
MTTDGEPFTNEEIEEFLAAATDPADNRVYYEDYVSMMSNKIL